MQSEGHVVAMAATALTMLLRWRKRT